MDPDGRRRLDHLPLYGRHPGGRRPQEAWLSAAVLEDLASEALALQGSPSWAANVASPNTVTLYRLIRDISGSQRFRPLGVLAVTVDAGYFLDHTPSLSQKFQPRIVAVAGDQVLFRHRTGLDPDAVVQAVNGAPSRAIAASRASGTSLW